MLIIATFAMLVLAPASSLCQAGKSGISGVVVQIGHPGPSHHNDPPQYYKGPLEVMRAVDGHLATTTTSDENGKFSVSLPPGKYFIIQTNPVYSKVHSEPITVENGKFTFVKITADNGMR
ncbi:MAG TPA: carboxypeptidase-like regulatory domain-containing protein [Candidatus Angelobacter sp.]|nr:carboxypeptidase-like regulatory domain-containing protein [Candidatus Angelobacter sp.]